MNLALSEGLGQELLFAKRINSNGATKLKLWSNKVWIQIWSNSNLKLSKHVWVGLMDRGVHNEEVSIGFVGFGLTSTKL